jgi:glycosyltransferase involved in cell wall biosynthesis
MISIIIPTLNEKSVIEGALKHLKEKLKNIPHEIIVSDGKSMDGTIETAKLYADKVVVWDKPTRQTIALGRNLGAESATGDYLVFMDADTFLIDPATLLQKAQEIFEQRSEIVALTLRLRVFAEMETLGDKLIFGSINMLYPFLNNVLHTGASGGEFQMVRTESFKKVGGYRGDLAAGEDHDLFRRLSKIGRTHFAKELVAYHTGRRGHTIGWPKLLWQWGLNYTTVLFFKRAAQKVWEPIR